MRKLTRADFLGRVKHDPETKCWLYRGYISPDGYGVFGSMRTEGKIKPRCAHWFSYEEFVGPRHQGMHIHHLCHNKACVNPEHLVQLDPAAHSREHYGDTCPRGHGAEHWRIRKNGSRYCRTCDRQRTAENRAARSVPCTACGKPRMADKDAGPRRNFTGLCLECWQESRRKSATASNAA